jgi:hypothetical protein
MTKRIFISLLFCFTVIGFAVAQFSIPPPPLEIGQPDSVMSKDTIPAGFVVPGAPMGGTVEVSFRIDDNGAVDIVNIHSNDPVLIEYVINKLSKIKLDAGLHEPGKMITYRFTFKKQA